jgi:hypothetical protein
MERKLFTTVLIVAFASLFLGSCETPVGQGAGWGAAGAI